MVGFYMNLCLQVYAADSKSFNESGNFWWVSPGCAGYGALHLVVSSCSDEDVIRLLQCECCLQTLNRIQRTPVRVVSAEYTHTHTHTHALRYWYSSHSLMLGCTVAHLLTLWCQQDQNLPQEGQTTSTYNCLSTSQLTQSGMSACNVSVQSWGGQVKFFILTAFTYVHVLIIHCTLYMAIIMLLLCRYTVL